MANRLTYNYLLLSDDPQKVVELSNVPIKVKNDFRNDIAVLRAIAIISVFAFHFCPDFFPQGFLGVDIFFVISGVSIVFLYTVAWKRRYFPMFGPATYMFLNVEMENLDIGYFSQVS
ncbi:unnamed protein product, partial [Mesorhabditis belari]|uniref:Acyltransferase 3 domain-containing protein n=1 Tax=Mesorhabditis belari TaxID=2138241 RepID=A0AAF3ER78_9BILA